MSAAPPPDRSTATRDAPELPAPVSGQRHEISSKAGRLTYYASSPDKWQHVTPLLLVHSINAAGSAYEVKPLYEHYRESRAVYAIELPGFGHSERSDRPYTVRMMTDAIVELTKIIQNDHGNKPIDAVGVSLSCEFVARAVSEMPLAFRSVALVSPTGFNTKVLPADREGGTRAMPWLRAIFDFRLWSEPFFRLLSSQASINFFLAKTWGSKNFDRGLAAYDYLTTHQPGARHAPYYFVSGYLFSKDIMRVYHSLTLPVWMSHGVRGDFVDYTYKREVEGRPNWRIDVFDTGAMPHFEAGQAFIEKYDSFIAGLKPAGS